MIPRHMHTHTHTYARAYMASSKRRHALFSDSTKRSPLPLLSALPNSLEGLEDTLSRSENSLSAAVDIVKTFEDEASECIERANAAAEDELAEMAKTSARSSAASFELNEKENELELINNTVLAHKRNLLSETQIVSEMKQREHDLASTRARLTDNLSKLEYDRYVCRGLHCSFRLASIHHLSESTTYRDLIVQMREDEHIKLKNEEEHGLIRRRSRASERANMTSRRMLAEKEQADFERELSDLNEQRELASARLSEVACHSMNEKRDGESPSCSFSAYSSISRI